MNVGRRLLVPFGYLVHVVGEISLVPPFRGGTLVIASGFGLVVRALSSQVTGTKPLEVQNAK